MKNFPMFLRVAGRTIVIVGNGEQAAQKARLALKTEADILLIADGPDAELRAYAESGRIRVQPDADASTFQNTVLVFIATGCKGADAGWHGVAKAAGAIVNVVDSPNLCDAITPSIVDRDPLVVAIGTEGTAPILGRQTKSRIEELLEPGLGRLATLSGSLRNQVAQYVAREDRRPFWRWVFSKGPRLAHATGDEAGAKTLIENAISEGSAPGEQGGSLISIIGGADQAGDLMTLRAVQRLQEADAIFHPPDTDPSVLELARRDAERIVLTQAQVTSRNDTFAAIQRHSDEAPRAVWLVSSDSDALQEFAGEHTALELIPTARSRIGNASKPA